MIIIMSRVDDPRFFLSRFFLKRSIYDVYQEALDFFFLNKFKNILYKHYFNN